MCYKSVITVCVMLQCFQYGVSILCYECSSHNNTFCTDLTQFDRETIHRFLPVTDCGDGVLSPNQNFFCRKIVQTIYRRGISEVVVVRSCGWVRSYTDCYTADNQDHLETVCQCFTNQCNGARGDRPGTVIVMALVGLMKWLMGR